jgi:hypothetical protein
MKNVVFVIVSMALAPWWVLAQNGVVLINQATVAATGVNRSTGGFPHTITQPGSYQLSGNLTVPANTDAIDIVANNVTLDLNGFSIIGPVVCSGSPATCIGGFNLPGIGVNGSGFSGITVINGGCTEWEAPA